MKDAKKAGLVSLAVLLVAVLIAGAAEQSAKPAAAITRYSGVASVGLRPGAAVTPLRVEMKDWNFARTDQAVKLPIAGFYIVQLTSGKIDTEIAGKTEHRRAGDFWTVAAGETMSVSFPKFSESAQMKTIAVGPAGR